MKKMSDEEINRVFNAMTPDQKCFVMDILTELYVLKAYNQATEAMNYELQKGKEVKNESNIENNSEQSK